MTRRITVPAAALIAALSTASAAAGPATVGDRRYADGVYSATGEYGNQPSHITVNVTLQGGIVRAVDVEPHAYVPRSLALQRAFARAVPRVVVGKPIDAVKIDKLAGSSGTPKGFNDAIRQIREQARRDAAAPRG
ncbi:hypothetical protein [Acuticoccus kandeliae]|uniref:hypothetical protein n=1 Tax=Acuticoccus kandeliae TaxID=2073160 RepID=UPI00196AD307|nr:hypothetical protein [Acuticoccus kandeliae]